MHQLREILKSGVFRFGFGLLTGLLLLTVLAGCNIGTTGFNNPGKGQGNQPGNLPQRQQVLYIPLDNRPLNYHNVLNLAEIAGVKLLTPPVEYLGQGDGPGDTGRIGQWLKEHAHRGDAWVISLDMLLYGGLAPSRSHDLERQEVLDRMQSLRAILATARERDIPVYVLATAMRSAASGTSAKQPGYFARYGDQILRLSQLSDLADLKQATPAQLAEMDRIKKAIPPDVLNNYVNRRQVNLAALEEAVHLTAEGFITYLVLGRDDTTPYSFTRLEMRQLAGLTEQREVAHRVDSYPGADELGALLLARAVNHLENREPLVYVDWGTPRGPGITALYEDISLGDSVALHIKSGGGKPADSPGEADLVLVMNTPESKVVEAVLQPGNNDGPLPRHQELARRVAGWQREGNPVAVADVAYANGSDRALMTALGEAGVLPNLAAYAGCNTAGNSMGMALAQGMIWSAGDTRDDSSRNEELVNSQRQYLLTRLGEDWGFQAMIRPGLVARQNKPMGAGTTLDAATVRHLEQEITRELNEFFQAELNPLFGQKGRVTNVTLPWHRLFDIELTVDEYGKLRKSL